MNITIDICTLINYQELSQLNLEAYQIYKHCKKKKNSPSFFFYQQEIDNRYLHTNQLSGTIPTELGILVNLKYL